MPFLDFIKKYYLLISLFVLYLLVTYLLKIPNCLVKLVCGYPCPGCGLTRAGFAVLRFDFAAAVHFNPLIFIFKKITQHKKFRHNAYNNNHLNDCCLSKR